MAKKKQLRLSAAVSTVAVADKNRHSQITFDLDIEGTPKIVAVLWRFLLEHGEYADYVVSTSLLSSSGMTVS